MLARLGGWLAACLVLALGASRALAEPRTGDWLAVLSPCGSQPTAAATLAFVYPKLGLPALVPAGALLTVRVQLPAALTPPPGIQQERALRGFAAELRGAPLFAVGPDAALHARYTLPVVNLRPDGASSLVYRVSLAVPAYAAPGTYAVALRTPFGSILTDHVVRVLEAGHAPRVAWLPGIRSGPLPVALRDLPIDAWLSETLPALDALPPSAASGLSVLGAAPTLAIAAPERAAAFIAGERVLVLGAESCRQSETFAHELALAAAGRVRVDALQGETPVGPARMLDGSVCELSAPASRIASTGQGFALSNADGQQTRSWPIALGIGQRVAVSGGTLTLFPSSDVSRPSARALIGILSVPAGGTAQLTTLPPTAATPPLELQTQGATTGKPITLHLIGVGAGAPLRVAFDLGFARSLLGNGSRFTTELAEPGRHALAAFVIAPDARVQQLHAELWIEARRPPTCEAIPMLAGSRAPGVAQLLLLVLMALMALRWRRSRARHALAGRDAPLRVRLRDLLVALVPPALAAKKARDRA